MSNQALFVPVEESIGDAAGHTSLSVSLYEVMARPAAQEEAWLISGFYGNIQKKIRAYFELYPDSRDMPAQLMLEGSNRIRNFTGSMQSVTLGLFIGFMRFLRRRELRSGWDTVTLTGDLRPHGDRVYLYPVEHIKEKYAGVQAYAEAHPGQRHLFLYISDKMPVKIGRHGNLEVKSFHPDDPLGEALACVFERQFNEEQQSLFRGAGASLSRSVRYVETKAFNRIKREACSPDWKGYLIHGEGETGKSALALELAYYLAEREYIYAPVWIKIDNNKLQEAIKKTKPREHIDPLDNPFVSFIATSIAETLCLEWKYEDGLARLAASIDRKGQCPYLLVIDNLEIDRADEVTEAAKTIIDRVKNRIPPFILTSRVGEKEAGHAQRIGLRIKPQGHTALTLRETALLVENTVLGQGYEQKLAASKNSGEFQTFVNLLYRHFNTFPGLIIQLASLIERNTIHDLIPQLLVLADKPYQEKVNAIYRIIFSQLDDFTQAVLFAFIAAIDHESSFDDLQSDKHQIASWIEMTGWMPSDGTILKNWEIEEKVPESLATLERSHVIYQIEQIDQAGMSQETRYGIKSLPYITFMFEDEFNGEPQPFTGESLRNTLCDPVKMIVAGLRSNQPAHRLKPLLERLEKEYKDPFEYALLCIAASCSNRPEHIDLLLEFGYPLYERWTRLGDQTPIQCAVCSNSNPDILGRLLDRGANLREKDDDGNTILHFAASNNQNPEIIAMLIDRGLDMYVENKSQWSSIFYAARNSNPAIIKMFFKKGAKMGASSSDGSTPLHHAALNPNPDILKWLIGHRLNINATNKMGWTPLHAAVLLDGNTAIINLLLKHGADINAKATDTTQKFDWEKTAFTPLHLAAAQNKTSDNISLLVKKGADIRAKAYNGDSPLHTAAWVNPEPDMITFLLANGALIGDTNSRGETPLYSAAKWNKNPQAAINLIQAGARLDDIVFEPGWFGGKHKKTVLQILKKRKDWPVIEAAIEGTV